jgi:hypothetical protein
MEGLTMRKFVLTTGAFAVLFTAAGLGLAASAAAGDGADGVVSKLENQGYNVQYLPPVPRSLLPQCSVNSINPSNLDQSASVQEKQHTLVEVDLSCPPN